MKIRYLTMHTDLTARIGSLKVSKVIKVSKLCL